MFYILGRCQHMWEFSRLYWSGSMVVSWGWCLDFFLRSGFLRWCWEGYLQFWRGFEVWRPSFCYESWWYSSSDPSWGRWFQIFICSSSAKICCDLMHYYLGYSMCNHDSSFLSWHNIIKFTLEKHNNMIICSYYYKYNQ